MKGWLIAGAFAGLFGLALFVERRMFGPRASGGVLELLLEILSHLL